MQSASEVQLFTSALSKVSAHEPPSIAFTPLVPDEPDPPAPLVASEPVPPELAPLAPEPVLPEDAAPLDVPVLAPVELEPVDVPVLAPVELEPALAFVPAVAPAAPPEVAPVLAPVELEPLAPLRPPVAEGVLEPHAIAAVITQASRHARRTPITISVAYPRSPSERPGGFHTGALPGGSLGGPDRSGYSCQNRSSIRAPPRDLHERPTKLVDVPGGERFGVGPPGARARVLRSSDS